MVLYNKYMLCWTGIFWYLCNCQVGMNNFKKLFCLRATITWSNVHHNLMCALIIKTFPPVLWYSKFIT